MKKFWLSSFLVRSVKIETRVSKEKKKQYELVNAVFVLGDFLVAIFVDACFVEIVAAAQKHNGSTAGNSRGGTTRSWFGCVLNCLRSWRVNLVILEPERRIKS